MSAASQLIRINKGIRESVLFVFIGEPGTGKSTIMKGFMDMNTKNLVIPSNMSEAPQTWSKMGILRPSTYHVADPTDPAHQKKLVRWRLEHLNTFQGNKIVDVSVLSQSNYMYDFLPSILNANNPHSSFQYGGFFLDDMKNYVRSQGQLSHAVSDPLRARRHIGVDFFFACHRFQDVNSEFYGFGAKLFIFKTNTPPSKTAVERLSPKCQQQLYYVIEKVNERAKKDRHFWHPFDPSDEALNAQLIAEARL
jgi:hypothetical protein